MKHDDKTQQPAQISDAHPADPGRRSALKKLGKAAYIAPTVSIVAMDALLNTAAGSLLPGCGPSGGRPGKC